MEYSRSAAVVTGGASGLGAATVRHLASLGASVLIIDKAAEAGERLATEVAGRFVEADVTDESSLSAALAVLDSFKQPLRITVNAVGVGELQSVLGRNGVHSLELFRRIIEINLIGAFNVVRLCAARMSEVPPADSGERGVIINTSSIAGHDGPHGQAAYTASKAGVSGMTLTVARDLGRFGIRVMTIAPGIFRTPMSERLPKEALEAQTNLAAFPRSAGAPSSFAKLVESICENPMLNGEEIRLDAGLRL